jgi:hypothetical protein
MFNETLVVDNLESKKGKHCLEAKFCSGFIAIEIMLLV